MALHRLLERLLAEKHRGPVAVFDLDSTLLSTQRRNWVILREYAGRAKAGPELRAAAERLRPEDMRWNIMEDLRRVGFDRKDELRDLRSFWGARFFADDYLRHDEPLPGAVEFVRDVHAAGATVVYLTGRDATRMGRGTRESLRAHGFPGEDRGARLLLKPRHDEDDLDFKRRACAEIERLGPVLCAFENEPANANLFKTSFPEADVVLLDTVHSPDPPPLLPSILRVPDFRR